MYPEAEQIVSWISELACFVRSELEARNSCCPGHSKAPISLSALVKFFVFLCGNFEPCGRVTRVHGL